MFILLGMWAIAASDLLILLERRNSGGFYEYIPLLISRLLRIYPESFSNWTTQRMPVKSHNLLLNDGYWHSCLVTSISKLTEPSVA